MKTAKLKNGLICVSVPMDATDFHKSNHAIGFKSNTWKHDRDCNNWCYVSFGLGGALKFEILGTITKDECSFDCSKYVEKYIGGPIYRDYKRNVNMSLNYGYNNPLDSFKSMIENETEFLFENPYKEPDPTNWTNFTLKGEYRDVKYNQSQSRVIEKILILKTI